VPAGTIARGAIALLPHRDDPECGNWHLTYRIPLAQAPQAVEGGIYFGWHWGKKDRVTWQESFRGVETWFAAEGLLNYAAKTLTCSIEERNTERGDQLFRVVRIEWEHHRRSLRRG
jgi:hypothetical protein